MKKNQALVVAHFHKSGKLRSDTIKFLNCCEKKFKRVIFVSTNLNPSEHSKLPKFVECHTRENLGYDFFSYRLGIEQLRKDINLDPGHEDKIHQVTVLNTSFLIFNPERFLQSYFIDGLQKQSADFCGLTMHPASGKTPAHLQSFLLTFSDALLKDPQVINWWNRLSIFEEKSLIIKKYEMGISKYLGTLGYMPNPIYKPKSIRNVLDPTHDNYEEILDIFSFLKIGLYTLNPSKLSMRTLNTKISESESFKNLIVEGMEN